jgi:hypothetical protein
MSRQGTGVNLASNGKRWSILSQYGQPRLFVASDDKRGFFQ